MVLRDPLEHQELLDHQEMQDNLVLLVSLARPDRRGPLEHQVNQANQDSLVFRGLWDPLVL